MFCKKCVLNTLANSQEKTCVGVSSLIKLQASGGFPVNFNKSIRTSFLYRTPPVVEFAHCNLQKALKTIKRNKKNNESNSVISPLSASVALI